MTPQTILLLIAAILVISYLFDQLLDYLNLRALKPEIPSEVAKFYDQDKYIKSIAYEKTQTKFSFLSSALSFVISFSVLVSGGLGWLDDLLRQWISDPTLLTFAFFGVIAVASDIFSLPVQLYSIFVIEEKFGFNKTTLKTFFSDKIKSYALGGIIGGLLLWVMIYLMNKLGPDFWIWFGIVAGLFTLFMNMFYSSLILPLFNKLTPLPDGELKNAINAFAHHVKFPLENVMVMDGSRRSKKANAFFSGIGKKKKIVLYDTLIENHSTDELVAVLAHEVGHFKKNHIVWGYFLSLTQIFLMLYLLSLMVFDKNLSLALGGHHQAIHLNLLAFGILLSPLSAITGLGMNLLSRKNEFEADAYASQTHNAQALGNALKKLSVDSLSNLFPHPWYVFFHYSHPPLLQRLKALKV